MQRDSKSSGTPEHRKRIRTKYPGIYKRGSRYQVSWREKGRPRWKSCRTLSEARRLKAETNAGIRQPESRTFFPDYAEVWIAEYAGRTSGGLADSTRASYADAIRRLAVPFFGRVRLSDIDPPMIREFVKHLEDQGYAPATAKRYVAPVRALFATAYEDGLIMRNPAQGLRVIVKDLREPKRKSLTADETIALLNEIPGQHRNLVILIATTGLRISESLRLRWSDVQLNGDHDSTVRVRVSKTDAGRRTLTITPETTRILRAQRELTDYPEEESPVFPNLVGKEMNSNNFRRRVFNPAAERAGVGWIRPHGLRHGVASLMATRRLSPYEIAAQLGHADGGVLVLKTYIHDVPTAQTTFIDDSLQLSRPSLPSPKSQKGLVA